MVILSVVLHDYRSGIERFIGLFIFVTVDTAVVPANGNGYIKREPQDHKALLHGILSHQPHAAALLASYTASNTGNKNSGKSILK